MPTEYTLSDLVKLTGVTERTVRFYISQGLLPPPTHKGPNARYSEAHLDRLRLIRKMQVGHLPLAEIRRQLDKVTDVELSTLAEAMPSYEPPSDSALDYIDSVLGRRGVVAPTPIEPPPAPTRASSISMPSMRAPEPGPEPRPQPSSMPSTEPPPPNPEPSRGQWERISLDADVELHIRRPLTRHKNRTIERLITIARQLLEE
jgi:DNA-binding transcriptional MerR regulator